ncbi:MAG: 3-phosphoshikimate 1-carboxyvinyltransferase [Verrucomicrobiota bacterium]|jgi:3-phosphoshikimate 1-carboxyvinyltransferase|nr:3-phosphoshikimate 1-carboxyvinyltransferase [Verrucomicrobiota bacterium]
MQHALDLTVSAAGPLSGELLLPGDKSLSHRAALFAALAEGESVIDRFLVSGVTRAMLNALTALGVDWRLDGARLTVRGRGLRGFVPPSAPLDCGNSATTLRLLAGALAAAGTPCVLDGSAGLRKRPMNRITEPLQRMGAPITTPDGCAPLALAARAEARPLNAADLSLPVASAQVKSCLILAALAADGMTVIREPGPSRDHTERMLSAMGADIRVEGLAVSVAPLAHPLAPLRLTLPGDISSAAFLLVAAALVPGSSVFVRDVGINPTRTGILDVLRKMGARVAVENPRVVAGEPVGDIRLTAAPLQAVCVGGDTVVRMIDEFPVFAVAACFAEGVTEVRDAEELRYKETDRISVLCGELQALGVKLTERRDGFTIQGGTLSGGVCEAHGDHRLAMSLALAGLAAPSSVTVRHAEILNESFPDFVSQIRALGAEAREETISEK